MFKKFSNSSSKKNTQQPTKSEDQLNTQFDTTINNLKIKKDQSNEAIDRLDCKLERLDKEIKSLLQSNKKQYARSKLIEMKGIQKQIQNLQTKINTLTQMILSLEIQQSDTGITECLQDGVNLGKIYQETNEQLDDILSDWKDQINSQKETEEIFKQFESVGIDNEEIDAELEKYIQDNEHEKSLTNKFQELKFVPNNQIFMQQNSQNVNKSQSTKIAEQQLETF